MWPHIITALAILILVAFVSYIIYSNAVQTFKVGYYEQRFKDHKDKFTDEEWKHIQDVMNRKIKLF